MMTMTGDLINRIHEQQAELSTKWSKQLFREFRLQVNNGNLSALEGYVRNPFREDFSKVDYEVDYGLVGIVVKDELKSAIYDSIRGYTDWVLGRMVRLGDNAMSVPTEIDFATIEKKYYAPPKTLRKTVSLMRSKRNLPLLGRIKDGKFNPDPEEFQRWKNLYDWNRSDS